MSDKPPNGRGYVSADGATRCRQCGLILADECACADGGGVVHRIERALADADAFLGPQPRGGRAVL